MVAIWSSLLLVVGVASQATVDPASTVVSAPGTGYQAPAALGQLAQALSGPAPAPVPVGAQGPAPAGTFNPMAVQAAPVVQQHGISTALNAAINGDTTAAANAEKEAIAEAPSASARFVDGFIGGYLEDVTLQTGEKFCIRKNIHEMTKDGVSLISELATVIIELVEKKTPDVMGLMAGAGQVISLGTTTQALIKQCVKADAAAVMEATATHLKSPPYVQGRLLANGLDIMKVFADSIQAAEKDNWILVGIDFGKIMRKTLLSENTQAVQLVLPEGMEASQVGSTTVEGVIEGMFVQGTTLTITSTADPSVNIFIDLHNCIAKEAPYMTTVMNTLYLAISQLSVQIERMQLAQQGVQAGMTGQTAQTPIGDTGSFDMSSLSGLMTNIPVMMDRCGITAAQKNDMKKAFKDMKDLKAAFTIPGPSDKSAATNEAAKRVEDATKYWESGQYLNFGEMTGGLARDLLLTMFPGKANAPPARLYNAAWQLEHSDDASRPGSLALVVGGFAAVTLLGMALFRIASKTSSPEHHPTLLTSETDCEDIE